ncbi:mitochondrial uncoupling protein 4-like [Watersipora subatra]|uniref:mitochondrial uncoupling protein 4-like n=1 Tax=Watersipora subatra TaxID=2589382 RepID=UPI00355B29EC
MPVSSESLPRGRDKTSGVALTMKKFVLCGAAATVAETATFPLDLFKTRLQLQYSTGSATKNKGMMSVARGIVVDEGFFRLWKGLSPALYRHYIYTSARMVVYEAMRDTVISSEYNQSGTFPVWQSALCGAFAGGLGQFLASPADLVKVNMQMEGKRKLDGLPPRYKSPFHAFKSILKQRGALGLWRGWAPNVQRAALVNLGDLTAYDTVKKKLLKNTSLEDNWICHFLSSCCAGVVAAILSAPADLIKARVMNQPHDENGRPLVYRSSVACLVKTVKNEGFFALYKGFLPSYIRMGPWSLLFWMSYEEIRKASGVQGF